MRRARPYVFRGIRSPDFPPPISSLNPSVKNIGLLRNRGVAIMPSRKQQIMGMGDIPSYRKNWPSNFRGVVVRPLNKPNVFWTTGYKGFRVPTLAASTDANGNTSIALRDRALRVERYGKQGYVEGPTKRIDIFRVLMPKGTLDVEKRDKEIAERTYTNMKNAGILSPEQIESNKIAKEKQLAEAKKTRERYIRELINDLKTKGIPIPEQYLKEAQELMDYDKAKELASQGSTNIPPELAEAYQKVLLEQAAERGQLEKRLNDLETKLTNTSGYANHAALGTKPLFVRHLSNSTDDPEALKKQFADEYIERTNKARKAHGDPELTEAEIKELVPAMVNYNEIVKGSSTKIPFDEFVKYFRDVYVPKHVPTTQLVMVPPTTSIVAAPLFPSNEDIPPPPPSYLTDPNIPPPPNDPYPEVYMVDDDDEDDENENPDPNVINADEPDDEPIESAASPPRVDPAVREGVNIVGGPNANELPVTLGPRPRKKPKRYGYGDGDGDFWYNLPFWFQEMVERNAKTNRWV